MHDRGLLVALEQWRDWPISQQPEFVKSFDAGFSHKTCLLKADNHLLVLKLFEQSHAPAINIQQWAAKHSLAPKILYFDNGYSYCLMEYCNGGQSKNVDALASKLKQLHIQAVPSVFSERGPLNLAAVQQRYLVNANKEAIDVHQQLQPLLELFFNDSSTLCCCHNDLVAENYMEQNNQPILIDWEYAQLNNPWFDIASAFYYFKLDAAARIRFMHAYDKTLVEKLDQPIVTAALCTVVWTDILWHLDRDEGKKWSQLKQTLDQLRAYASQLGVSI